MLWYSTFKAKTIKNVEALQTALETVDAPLALSAEEHPLFVDDNLRELPSRVFLTEDDVRVLRESPVNSPRYRIYLAWRRFASLRLYAQGFTQREVADQLGVSEQSVRQDIAKVRVRYQGIASKDWAMLVEERIVQIDQDIQELRRMLDRTRPIEVTDENNMPSLYVVGLSLDDRLKVYDRIWDLETKRDKILGLDKAAAAKYEPERRMTVQLSFDQNSMVQPATHQPPALEIT